MNMSLGCDDILPKLTREKKLPYVTFLYEEGLEFILKKSELRRLFVTSPKCKW